MTSDEKRIEEDVLAYAKKTSDRDCPAVNQSRNCRPEANPVSVFMPGSPGAGKTEASIELLKLKGADGTRVLRIDPDELREDLPGYTGENSWLFQRTVIPIFLRS